MRKITKLGNLFWTASLIIFGLVLVLVANDNVSKFNILGFDVQTALSTIGTFITISAIVSFYFENQSKQKMFEEVFEKVVGSNSVLQSGIVQCIPNSRDINYSLDFQNTKSIRTFFSYSTDFLKKYAIEIERLLDKGGNVDIIFLSRDSATIEAMRKLGWQDSSIESSYEQIEEIATRLGRYEKFRVHFVNAIPRYSAICFDNTTYVIENTVSTGRTSVPATKLSGSGFLSEFYADDLNRVCENDVG